MFRTHKNGYQQLEATHKKMKAEKTTKKANKKTTKSEKDPSVLSSNISFWQSLEWAMRTVPVPMGTNRIYPSR